MALSRTRRMRGTPFCMVSGFRSGAKGLRRSAIGRRKMAERQGFEPWVRY